MTEADLAPIADLLPDDVEQDPGPASYDFGDPRVDRGIVSHQAYWRAHGTWRPRPGGCPFVWALDRQFLICRTEVPAARRTAS